MPKSFIPESVYWADLMLPGRFVDKNWQWPSTNVNDVNIASTHPLFKIVPKTKGARRFYALTRGVTKLVKKKKKWAKLKISQK